MTQSNASSTDDEQKQLVPCCHIQGVSILVKGSPARQAYLRGAAQRAVLYRGVAVVPKERHDAEFVQLIRAYWGEVAKGWTVTNDGEPKPDEHVIALHCHYALEVIPVGHAVVIIRNSEK